MPANRPGGGGPGQFPPDDPAEEGSGPRMDMRASRQDRDDPDRDDNGAVSRIELLCIERGLKMTGQRRLIARVLSDSADHPDVEELYRRAAALDQRISIATVYRTVRLLEEKGILERRDFGGGRARFDPADRGHHYHLIDVDSGRVVEFSDERHEALAREIAARLGFDLVDHRLELFGRRRTQPEAAAKEQAAPKRTRRGATGAAEASPAPAVGTEPA